MPHLKNLDTFFATGDNLAPLVMAQAAAKANNHGLVTFIGNSGYGKSHLCEAVAAAVNARPRATLYHTNGETFAREALAQAKAGTLKEWVAGLLHRELLVVDDFDRVLNYSVPVEEFTYLLETYMASSKQVVLSASQPFRTLDIPDRLRTRLSWGVVSRLHPMEPAAIRGFFRYLLGLHGLLDGGVDDRVFDVLTDHVELSNARELEGVAVQLAAYMQARADRHISVITFHNVLRLRFGIARRAVVRVQPDDILDVLVEEFNVQLQGLLSARRTKNLAGPRQLAMYLMKQLCGLTLTEIGSRLGGRDHSTVLYGVNKVSSRCYSDSEYRIMVERLSQKISLQRQE